MATREKPIDNSNGISKVLVEDLAPGRYLFHLDAADAATTAVSIYRRSSGSSNDRPVAISGAAVTLTASDSAKEIVVGREDIVLQSSVADTISVEVTRIPY